MKVVTPFHAALDLDRDQQTHGNREQMNQKIRIAAELSVWQMNIEHRRTTLPCDLPRKLPA
jgi:hypothetical protein